MSCVLFFTVSAGVNFNRRCIRCQLRQPEVQNLGLSLSGHEDIRWLDVAMDDAFSVGRVQPLGDLNSDIDQPVELQRSSLVTHVL